MKEICTLLVKLCIICSRMQRVNLHARPSIIQVGCPTCCYQVCALDHERGVLQTWITIHSTVVVMTSIYGGGPDVTSRNSKSRRVSWWTRSRFLQVRVRLVHCSIGVGGTIDTLTHHLPHGAPTSQSRRRWIVWSGKCSGYLWWQVTHPDPVWS